MLSVPRDVWSLIGCDLALKDLLSLRRTCTSLNAIVIGMQSRWFRAYQWLLSKSSHKTSQRRVKVVVKKHNHTFNWRCFAHSYHWFNNHRELDKSIYQQYQEQQPKYTKDIENGTLTEANCKNHHHFVMIVPECEADIPLDKGYAPKRCTYIYYYLIESYRQRVTPLKSEITRYDNQIKNIEDTIKVLHQQLGWKRKLLATKQHTRNEIQTRLDNNNIFDGVTINTYRNQ